MNLTVSCGPEKCICVSLALSCKPFQNIFHKVICSYHLGQSSSPRSPTVYYLDLHHITTVQVLLCHLVICACLLLKWLDCSLYLQKHVPHRCVALGWSASVPLHLASHSVGPLSPCGLSTWIQRSPGFFM